MSGVQALVSVDRALQSDSQDHAAMSHDGGNGCASLHLERILHQRRQRWEAEYLRTQKAQGKNPKDDTWRNKYHEPAGANTSDLPKLPMGWCWATVEQLSTKVVDGTHHTPEYCDAGVAFISVKDIRDGIIHFDNCKFISDTAHFELSKRCKPEPNDVLITKSGTIGRLAVVKIDRPFSLFVSVALIKPINDAIFSDFLKLALDFYISGISIDQDIKGGLVKNLHLEDLRVVPVRLPPVDQQFRIVSEIEKQFSRLDSAKGSLKRVQSQLKRYRASVLAAASSGRLVRTEAELARTEKRDYEPASELLNRILQERRSRWEADYLAKQKAKPKNDAWQKKYKEPASPDTSSLPELPEGWCWATVEQLAAPDPNSITDGPFGSNLKTEHYTDSGPRVIRLQNIGDGIYLDEEAHISQMHFERLQKHRVFANDLVIAGFGEDPPRCCIIPAALGPAIVKADCIRFRPQRDIAVKYMNVVLNSDPVRKRTKGMVHGVGRPRLNLGEIRSIVLPVPPPNEQHRIVAEVERLLSIQFEVQDVIDKKIAHATSLRQSILRHAFTGRLIQ